MRFKGRIKSWNDERGFGFIEATQGGEEVFVPRQGFTQRSGRPQVGQFVSFEVELVLQGKKRAKEIAPFRGTSVTSNHDRTGRGAVRFFDVATARY